MLQDIYVYLSHMSFTFLSLSVRFFLFATYVAVIALLSPSWLQAQFDSCSVLFPDGPNLFVNGSFEKFDTSSLYCYQNDSCLNHPLGNISCFEGWSTGGLPASSDVYGVNCSNEFFFSRVDVDSFLTGWGPNPSDGEFAAGIITDMAAGQEYTEILANSLRDTLTLNTPYVLEFDAMFIQATFIDYRDRVLEVLTSPSPARLALYGRMAAVDIDTFVGCPLDGGPHGWQMIKSIEVPGELWSWSHFRDTITFDTSYESLALGSSCSGFHGPLDSVYLFRSENYYFFDDFQLYLPGRQFEVISDGECRDENLVIKGGLDSLGVFWYDQAGSIVSTSDTLFHPVSGLYELWLGYDGNCQVIEISHVRDTNCCAYDFDINTRVSHGVGRILVESDEEDLMLSLDTGRTWQLTNFFEDLRPDSLLLLIKGPHGCVSEVSLDLRDQMVSTRELGLSTIEVYPNPFESHLNISVPRSYPALLSIAIYDTHGRIVSELYLRAGTNRVDTSSLESGVYHLVLQGESGQKQIKIIRL